MKKTFLALLFFLFACQTPPKEVTPFIKVTVTVPPNSTPPVSDVWVVTNTATINGEDLFIEFEVQNNGIAPPASFVILFSERVRGNPVSINIRGLLQGEEVFAAQAVAIAGIAEVEALAVFCGDAIVDSSQEECDDGAQNSNILPNACRTSCRFSFCGDFIPDDGEECDDGNNTDADTCEANCSFPVCGNSIVDPQLNEQCDDGNQNINDGCRPNCSAEICGDGILDINEQCDDDNIVNGDGCESNCSLPECLNDIPDISEVCYFSDFTNFIAVGGVLSDIKSTDINIDGFDDIITVNSVNNSINTFVSNGDGTFVNLTLSNGGSPSAIALGDLDNNGSDDIVITNSTGNSVNVRLNNSGVIGPPSIIQVGTTPQSVGIGDFNKDNNSDIVTINSGSNNISVLRGNRNGTFQSALTFSVISPKIVLVADMDADNDDDIIVLSNTNATLFLAGGNLSFTSSIVFTFPAGADITSGVLADTNGNNSIELITSNTTNNKVTIVTFSVTITSIDLSASDPQDIQIKDISNDGFLDLIVSNFSTRSIDIFLGNGNSFESQLNIPLVTLSPRKTAIGDFNGDGAFDLGIIEIFNNTHVGTVLFAEP
jgi:cysteine-rich repeat protein